MGKYIFKHLRTSVGSVSLERFESCLRVENDGSFEVRDTEMPSF